MDTATSRSMTVLAFPKYPANPNFVIPRAVAESIFACQGSSRRSQRPWRSTMDTATSRSMTVLAFRMPLRNPVPFALQLRHSARSRGIHLCLPMQQPEKPAALALHYGYCDFAQYDGVGIPEVPGEPKLRHSVRSRGIHLCLPRQQPEKPAALALHYGYCDFRSMTVLVGQRRLCPLAFFACHSRSTRRTQTSSFRAQSRNPSLLANAAAGEASGLGAPLWILRLRAV